MPNKPNNYKVEVCIFVKIQALLSYSFNFAVYERFVWRQSESCVFGRTTSVVRLFIMFVMRACGQNINNAIL